MLRPDAICQSIAQSTYVAPELTSLQEMSRSRLLPPREASCSRCRRVMLGGHCIAKGTSVSREEMR